MKPTAALGLSACLWLVLALARLTGGLVPFFHDLPLLVPAFAFAGLGAGLLSPGGNKPAEELISTLLRAVILLSAEATIGLFLLGAGPGQLPNDLLTLLVPILLPVGIALVFIPPGRALAPALDGLDLRAAVRSLLPAAAINALVFLAVNLADTPLLLLVPAVVYLLAWGIGLRLPRRGLVLSACLAALCLALTAAAGWRPTWSRHVLWPVPIESEQARSLLPAEQSRGRTGQHPDYWTGVIIDGNFLDFAIDLDPVRIGMIAPRAPRETMFLAGMSEFYRLPFRLRPPGRALIVNSGLGNTLAAGSREGWQALEAQEDDPVLLRLGQSHPERPYQVPGLALHRKPVRSLLRQSPGPYDLIVVTPQLAAPAFARAFGYAHPASILTTEGIKAMADRLSVDGIVAVAISSPEGYVERRLFQMLSDRFGSASAWSWQNPAWNQRWTVISAGPGARRYRPRPGPGLTDRTAEISKGSSLIPASRNWPYLFLSSPGLGFLTVFFVVALMAINAGMTVPAGGFRNLHPGFASIGILLAASTMAGLCLTVHPVVVWTVCAMLLLLSAIVWGQLSASRRLGSILAGFGLAGPTSFMLLWLGPIWPEVVGGIFLLLSAVAMRRDYARK